MINELAMPFQFAFMQQAFATALIIAVPAAILSCFLVLKGWALMGDAISHAVLPGIVLAWIIGIPLTIGAFGAGMICAISTGFLTDNSRLREDTVMGVVFSGMFGLGLVMYTSIQTDVHLDHILFGDILGVSWADVVETGLLAAVVTVITLVKRKDLLLHSFDGQHAKAIGLSVNGLHYGLLTMLALTIVSALQAVGIILAIALLISPGAIAFLLTKRFDKMLLVATIVSVSSAFLGVYLSFFIDSAPAPTIVLIMALWFIVVFVVKSRINARMMANAASEEVANQTS
ncbi:MAG: metal ABC transporter permease [Salaquimonas sp.]